MPISTNEHAPFTSAEIRDLAAAVAQGFTHIVIPASRDWKVIQSQFRFDCRVHIVRLREPLKDITWEILQDRLHSATKLDERWLGKICPTDVRHPLLLPPSVFSTKRSTHDYWRRCDVYAEEQILGAEELLRLVDKEHWRPDGAGGRSWIDGKNLRYRTDRSKHGRSTADRANRKAYRFCFEVPPGFHYDVTDVDSRAFAIRIDGKAEK